MKYYSQDKQDYIIDTLLGKKEKGIFIDIGAHNGVKFSNSCFFERERNWTGVCVEPMPDVYSELQNNRNCFLVNAAISDVSGEIEFRRIVGRGDMLSGIAKYQSEEHQERMNSKIEEVGSSIEVIKVNSCTLSSIVEKFNIQNVDYLSIDVEGAELEIIKSIDFNSLNISYMTIENNYKSSEMRSILKDSMYCFLFRYGSDDFYAHRSIYRMSWFFNPKLLPIWLKFHLRRLFGKK